MHNYSAEDLICYLYKETSTETTAAIEQALAQDWTLREKLGVIKTSMERLNSLTESPRIETVFSILKYASKEAPVSSSN
jgi:hypothetical protein